MVLFKAFIERRVLVRKAMGSYAVMGMLTLRWTLTIRGGTD